MKRLFLAISLLGCSTFTENTKSALEGARETLSKAEDVCAALKPALATLVIDHQSFCALSTEYQSNLSAGVLYEITRLCSVPTTELNQYVDTVCAGVEIADTLLP